MMAWVVGALAAEAVVTTGALGRLAKLRRAAFAETCCSSLESSVRVLAICVLRPWASVTREWILAVVAAGVVVVAVSPDTELGAALPMSATDPPIAAPPVTTAVIKKDRPLIGIPISMSTSSNYRRARWVSSAIRKYLQADHTKGEPGGRIRRGQMVVVVVP